MDLRDIIENNFKKISRDSNKPISRQEIQNFLMNQSDKDFDRYILSQIFEECEKDNQSITTNRLTEVWIEGINSLNEKIEVSKQRKNDINQDYMGLIKKLDEIEKEEKLNANHIMDGSILIINILNAENIYDSNGNQFNMVISVNCEENEFKTIQTDGNTTFDFNEKIEFSIKTGKEDIIFEVFDANLMDKENPEFLSKININEFRDQKPHTKILEFNKKQKIPVELKLKIEIHWIYCKEKYIKQKIEEFNKEIKIIDKDIEEEQINLNWFYEPFSELKHKIVPINNYNTNKNDLMNEYDNDDLKERKFKYLSNEQNQSKIEKYLFYLMIVYFFLCLFQSICFCRFMEIMISGIYLNSIWTDLPKMNKFLCYFSCGIIFLAFIYKICWVIFIGNYYFKTNYVDGGLLSWIRNFDIILTYITLVIEIVIIVLMFNYGSIVSDDNVSFKSQIENNNNNYNNSLLSNNLDFNNSENPIML